MFARTTLFELDTVRMPLDAAVRLFQEQTLRAMRAQPGYEGMYLLATPEGKGMLISLWASEAAAQAGEASGYYDEQVAQYVMLMRQPPGRDHYEVMLADTPAAARA
jgi:heme-degrading monooxygenase HmoA